MKLRLFLFLTIFLTLTGTSLAQSARKPSTKEPAQGSNDRIEFQMVTVGKTNIRFPRLTFYRNAEVMREVNRLIDEVTSEFGCDGDLSNGPKGFSVTSRVEYAARDILSIYVSETFNCGGAHPTNDYNASLTFDLKTGTLVEFEDLFRDYETNKLEILKLIFARQIERAAKVAASGKGDDESCANNPDAFSLENLESSSFAFNFSSAGLRVQPAGWGHAFSACAERVTVPYETLKSFAAPGGLLQRVLQ